MSYEGVKQDDVEPDVIRYEVKGNWVLNARERSSGDIIVRKSSTFLSNTN